MSPSSTAREAEPGLAKIFSSPGVLLYRLFLVPNSNFVKTIAAQNNIGKE